MEETAGPGLLLLPGLRGGGQARGRAGEAGGAAEAAAALCQNAGGPPQRLQADGALGTAAQREPA